MSRPPTAVDSAGSGKSRSGGGLSGWLRGLRRPRKVEESVRETLEGLIEQRGEAEVPFNAEERSLLSNIFLLGDRTMEDVMVPRADIVAVEVTQSLEQAILAMTRSGHSRLPVYRNTLDDVLGMVHIKDLTAGWLEALRDQNPPPTLESRVRKLLFVAPSMRVLECLLEMRTIRVHMAVVVDEYGGVDGLISIEDLVEEIVGEIEDEHDREEEPSLVVLEDGSYEVDARVLVEDFEERAGPVFTAEERDEIDTLGGVVFMLAGRVPLRGELVTHPSGLEFQIVEADPRRIRRLVIRQRPSGDSASPPTSPASNDPH